MNNKTLRKHFIESLYQTLDGVVSPTPYLEITEGENVDVHFLNGKGRLPSPNSTEITILDLDTASLFFDGFHLLYEGVTGVGKTYTSDAIFNAVFGPNGYYNLRLSGGVLGSSALEPFTTTTLENGVPKTRIDHEKCAKYGALFIDEINRGDNQDTFQVVDGKIHVNGDTGYLRIPIPDSDKHKGLAIIAAMNPADAEHNAALELDIAGENRFLKFRFPNGVTEAASSQLEKKLGGELHEQFWTLFRKKSGLKGGWKEIYPQVTDSEILQSNLNGAVREFIDIALGYVGENPIKTYERNIELIKQGELEPHFSVRKDNDLDKIITAQNTLKHGFVRRDLRKIQDMSQLIGFIKSIKNGSYEPTVSLNDVAASIGVVLESKTITGSDYGALMVLVNDARTAYTEMHKKLNIPADYGIRQAIWQAAINTGQKHKYKGYLNTLQEGISQLNTQAENTAQATIKSRLLADLIVLEHFSKANEKAITEALTGKDNKPFKTFIQLYNQNKSQGSLYEHRLGPILR